MGVDTAPRRLADHGLRGTTLPGYSVPSDRRRRQPSSRSYPFLMEGCVLAFGVDDRRPPARLAPIGANSGNPINGAVGTVLRRDPRSARTGANSRRPPRSCCRVNADESGSQAPEGRHTCHVDRYIGHAGAGRRLGRRSGSSGPDPSGRARPNTVLGVARPDRSAYRCQPSTTREPVISAGWTSQTKKYSPASSAGTSTSTVSPPLMTSPRTISSPPSSM